MVFTINTVKDSPDDIKRKAYNASPKAEIIIDALSVKGEVSSLRAKLYSLLNFIIEKSKAKRLS